MPGSETGSGIHAYKGAPESPIFQDLSSLTPPFCLAIVTILPREHFTVAMSNVETSQPVAASGPVTEDDLVLQADDGAVAEGDSAYGGSDSNSDTTSVSSSIYQGVIQHGRRFQSYNVGEYHAPADERQFDAIDALHQVTVAIESGQDNPYFYSPIQPTAKNIIDLGAGTGAWAVDVADRFPNCSLELHLAIQYRS